MSSTPTSSTSATQSILKPNEYNKGLDQEHITKLTQDAYKHFVEYTKAELKSKSSCCTLTRYSNFVNIIMYSDGRRLSVIRKNEYIYAGKVYTNEWNEPAINERNVEITKYLYVVYSCKNMDLLNLVENIDADFSNFIQQIEAINQQSIEMENTAKALDEYSSYLGIWKKKKKKKN